METDTFAQLIEALASVQRALDEQGRYNELLAREQEKQWDEIAAVRDDMHLAIRGLTMAPEAVAEAIHPHLFACNPDESGGVDDD